MDFEFDFDNVLKAGGEILKDVESAVVSGNYSNLSDKVQKHVKDAAASVKDAAGSVKDAAGSVRDELKKSASDTVRHYQYAYDQKKAMSSSERGTTLHPKKASEYGAHRATAGNQNAGGQSVEDTMAKIFGSRNKNFVPTPFMQKNIDSNTGQGKKLAGIIGIVYGGAVFIPGLIRVIMSITSGNGGIISSSISMALGIAVIVLSALVLKKGITETGLTAKYQQYGKLIGNSEYISINELANMTGSTKEETIQVLNELMDAGFIQHAIYDRNKTTLLLTDNVIAQYRAAERAYLEKQEAELAAQTAEDQKGAEGSEYSEDVRKLLKEGKEYITHVRNVNDIIPDDQPMSDKLYRLENIMNRIFAQVRKDPSSAKNLRRFMDYYLPTITKLLDAYIELDKQDIQSGNIAGPKKEIEDTMDTVNDAFEELLDSMFQNMAWDISSDISVMTSMMKQDGLTGSGLHEKEKEKVPVEI